MIYRITDTSAMTAQDYHDAYIAASPERRQKADRCRFIADKRQCIFAYSLAVELLSRMLDVEPGTLEFYTDENKKPQLCGGAAHFSVSHSGGFVACATGFTPIGTDIEVIRKVSPAVVRRVCTNDELEYIFSAECRGESLSDDQTRRFLSVWTVKEAYLKYTGQGLSGSMIKTIVADRNGILPMLPTGQTVINEVNDKYAFAIVYTP